MLVPTLIEFQGNELTEFSGCTINHTSDSPELNFGELRQGNYKRSAGIFLYTENILSRRISYVDVCTYITIKSFLEKTFLQKSMLTIEYHFCHQNSNS